MDINELWLDAVLALSKSESSSTADPLVYEKEIVHVGKFVKDGPGGSMEYNINEGMLDHWVNTFREMSQDGVQIPVPVEHTQDPEKRRGTVLDLQKRTNGNGKPALYAKIKFRDHDAAKLSQSGVSIFVPKEMPNGNGKRYKMPLAHVAITDYPVISTLEPFKPIMLSFVDESDPQGDTDVTLRELATQAGIDPAITDEQQLLMALSQVIAKVKAPPAAPAGAPGAPGAGAGGAPVGGPRPPGPPMRFSNDVNEPAPLSASLLNIVRENRANKLDKLVAERKITPAVRKKLEEQYLTDGALQFSHVQERADNFDSVVAALSLNEPILGTGGKTGVQSAIELSKVIDPKQNPLIRDAERRAEEAKRGY